MKRRRPKGHVRPEVREEALRRLRFITGQVTGVTKMVEEEQPCMDILTQVAALRGGLQNFGMLMATAHIEESVYKQSEQSEESEDRIEEVRRTLQRFLK